MPVYHLSLNRVPVAVVQIDPQIAGPYILQLMRTRNDLSERVSNSKDVLTAFLKTLARYLYAQHIIGNSYLDLLDRPGWSVLDGTKGVYILASFLNCLDDVDVDVSSITK